jgi:hypothetical protein
MPNFLVIGAAKSGTEALCNFLGQHPDVYMCPHRGPGDVAWLGPEMWTSSRAVYEALFADATEAAIGEGTASYLYSEDAPARICRYVPDVRLIAILRNPVDRAYSAYSMMRGTGREPMARFVDALAAEDDRRAEQWEPIWHYVRMGLYARQLERYDQVFDRAQLRVVLYDDFADRPGEVLRELFGFLGVDDGFAADTSSRHNVSLVPRSSAVHALTVGPFAPRAALKAVVPRRLRERVQRRVRARNLVRPAPLDPAVRAQLVDVFRPDVLELQGRLDRDLSAWLR